MSLNSMVTDVANAVATFWIRAADRFTDAKIKAKGGTFTANELATDLVVTASDAIDFWMKVFPFTTPVIPTVFFADSAAAFVGQTPTRHASLSFSVPPATAATSTDLVVLGGNATIPQGRVQVAVKDTEVDVTLQITAKPGAGLYQGVAFFGMPPQVLVQIVVLVGP